MVDWKKEIKLSDLVGGGGKKKEKAKDSAAEEAAAERPAAVELLNAYVPEPTQGPSAAEVFGPLVGDGAPVPAAPAPVASEPEPEPVPAPAPELPTAPPVPAPLDLAASAPPPPGPPPAPVVELSEVAPATPLPPPQPVVVHPPVPAAQLQPLPDEPPPAKRTKEKAVPFSKQLGGKKGKVERRTARGAKLPKRLVGLKIGASQLAAATVENNGNAEVVQVAREQLEAGIVSNGELRDPDRLADALKGFFKRNGLPKRGVRLGIATNRIGVRTLEISGVDDPKQLANAVRFRAQEALPIPIDEAVLDYQLLGQSKNDAGETTHRILLVLAYRDLIDRYVGACKKAGLQLVGIDLEAFALLRALAAPREDGSTADVAVVAVTVGHDRTTFAVSDGRVCEFTRVLDWGGQTLNVALARALDVAPSDVEEIKRQLSLDGHEVPEGLREEQAHKAREAVRRQVQAFARELVSSLQFYQGQPGSLSIGEIVLTGGTAHLPGLGDELQRLIGVRVRVGDPLVRVRVGKKVKEPEQLGSLAVAIGLGIDD